ncbi:MAG: transcriptional regulator [Thermoleophilaceae bacterium]
MSVGPAREAAARGDWEQAYELLTQVGATSLRPADLPLLAEVAYAAGWLDVAIETWERAHNACLEAGDRVGAAGAAVRVAMHLMFDTTLMAPVRGWLGRAERLLEAGPEETPVHAWLAVVRAYERMLTGDSDGARAWARRAVELGGRTDAAAHAIGRVAEARLRLLAGEVDSALAAFDEVGAVAVSGALDPMSTGIVYCELVCALQGLGQYDVAEEWTQAMERWCQTNTIGSLHGRCRVHRAEILRLRGAFDEAEREAMVACEELTPYLRRELGWPLAELGRIRLRRGDVAGAEEALLAADRAGWDAQPGLALVRLARGHAGAAAVAIRDALERPARVPSKELPPDTDLQRAPLLDAQVEIEIAVGEIARAAAAAEELARIAGRFRSKALAAAASLARGRVCLAEADGDMAEQSCSEAARLWNEVGAPYETAVARLALAEALRSRDREDQAELEALAARQMLAQLEATASATTSERVFQRNGDIWSLAFAGLTVRVRDLKGLHYLARLLAHPGREVHVLDLVTAETGLQAPDNDAGELLDAEAKEAYRRRLEEIDEDIEQARALSDAQREAQADAERDFLVRELSRAVGLGGRDRRAGSASERARAAVTRAIRKSIVRIGEHHPELSEHLTRTVRTGMYCAYIPDPGDASGWTL